MTNESQNLSIMITDIKGYTDKSTQSSRNEIINLIRSHANLMIPIIEFYNGTIVKNMGDGYLCTFKSSTDAVICAIMIQLLLEEYNKLQKNNNDKMVIKTVINTGDVSLEGKDIYGDAVNIVSRMEKLECFKSITIGISESTCLLMNQNEIITDYLGEYELKGISRPIKIFSVPLGKQKLNQIPIRLKKLVQNVAQGKVANQSKKTKVSTLWNNLYWKIILGFVLLFVFYKIVVLMTLKNNQNEISSREYSITQSPEKRLNRIDEIKNRLAKIREMDQNKDGMITSEEFQDQPHIFRRLDRNHDGLITNDELEKPMERLSFKGNRMDERMDRAQEPENRHPKSFEEMDQNHDGFITDGETRIPLNIFRRLDRNNDQKLTREELQFNLRSGLTPREENERPGPNGNFIDE